MAAVLPRLFARLCFPPRPGRARFPQRSQVGGAREGRLEPRWYSRRPAPEELREWRPLSVAAVMDDARWPPALPLRGLPRLRPASPIVAL